MNLLGTTKAKATNKMNAIARILSVHAILISDEYKPKNLKRSLNQITLETFASETIQPHKR
jgi:hypothetical protein